MIFWDLRIGIIRHLRRVDWITQAALGAWIGELMIGKRLGNRALAWGALLGLLPNGLNLIFTPLLDTARELAWRPGQSLAAMAIGSWAMAHGLEKLWRREKIGKAQVGGLVVAVWSAQLLLACFSVEGAALGWPFSNHRVTLDFLPDVDLFLTLPLVVTALWLPFVREEKAKKPRGKKQAAGSKRRKLCYWGMGLSLGYALLAVTMKWVAAAGFEADLTRRGTKYERRMESPTPFNILLWRSVVDRGSEFWVGYRSVFERHATPVRWTVYPKGEEALATVAAMRETRTLVAITDGWWISRPLANGAWLGDLRFPEIRVWGSKKGTVDSRMTFSWIIQPEAKGDHLRRISPDSSGSRESLRRMGRRMVGNRDEWEGIPRLAGVPGSLPEFLSVEE